MTPLRTFIAIEFPLTIQDAIDKQTARLRQALGGELVRWTPSRSLHLTLKFLGDTSPAHLEFLKQMMTREASIHTQFELQVGGLGCFPNQRMARVLWIGLQGPAEMSALQKGIETGANRLGYAPDEHPFSPHLTIGRVRQSVGPVDQPKIRAAVEANPVGNIGSTRVDSLHLFQSELHTSGAVYTKLYSTPLNRPRGEI